MLAEGDRTHIHTLRVAGGADAARRAASLLASADLRPPGLPRGAILCVRCLPDPRPGGLRLGDSRPRLAWEEAARATLASLWRGAARPARGPVSPDAPAVLFADRADLLACLAHDLGAERLGAGWWWRRLLGAASPSAALRAWAAAPAAAPAALELLGAAGPTFAARLPPSEARALLAGVAAHFGLALALATLELRGPLRAARAAEAGALLRDVAPEARAPGLAPEQAALLGLGLLLRRAPTQGRGPLGAAALGLLLAGAAPPLSAPLRSPPPRHAQLRQAGVASPTSRRHPAAPGRASAPARRGGGAAPGPRRSSWRRVGPRRGRPGPVAAQRLQAPPHAPPAHPPPTQAQAVAAAETPVARSAPHLAAPPAGRRLGLPAAPAVGVDMAGGVWLETQLGGLCFLVNLALALDLYGDFTRPGGPALALDLWDFVALVGEGLLGAPPRHRDDPIWGLLARLAGRAADEAPGDGFRPPGAWRLPPGWLAPFGGAAGASWRLAGGRLLAEHPAGFALLDLPAPPAQPARAARRALGAYGASTAPRRWSDVPGRRSRTLLERWLDLLLPYLRARLALALGCRSEEIAATLLELPARLEPGPTRLDVCMRLSALPVAVRLAGLDRDPGWVPAAGLGLYFHFEEG